jgi:hypothetical protein
MSVFPLRRQPQLIRAQTPLSTAGERFLRITPVIAQLAVENHHLHA